MDMHSSATGSAIKESSALITREQQVQIAFSVLAALGDNLPEEKEARKKAVAIINQYLDRYTP